MTVVRVVLLLLLSALLLFGDAFKLYMKDGSYHMVREYQVQGDRVRYFSTERGEWEEIPLELLDLDKTEGERKAINEHVAEETREEKEEENALREQRREIASIPLDSGAYYEENDKIRAVPIADYTTVTDKKRKVLQVLSPVPLVPGKASVVIKGEHSKFIITDPKPGFFIRLSKQERFGIISLTPKKSFRVVENIATIPVAKQAYEERKQMDTFEQQLGEGLYRIWPEKPLTPGEYALVEFADTTDPDNIELLVWDFAYQPTAAGAVH